MALPPDEPTQPLRPARAAPVDAPPARAAVVDDPAWEQMVLARLDSLRTGMAILGLVALAALALAAWALLRSDDDRDNGRRGASPAEVSALRDRVDELQSRIDKRAPAEDVSKLQTSQQKLADRVDNLETKTSKEASSSDDVSQLGSDIDELKTSVDGFDQRIEDLDQRVQDLEDQQQSQSP